MAAKFVHGISVVAAPMAGALGMSWLTFVWVEFAAAAVWTGLLMGAGAVLRTQIEQTLDFLSTTSAVATGVLVMVIAAHTGLRYWRRVLVSGLGVTRIGIDELRDLMNDPPGRS